MDWRRDFQTFLSFAVKQKYKRRNSPSRNRMKHVQNIQNVVRMLNFNPFFYFSTAALKIFIHFTDYYDK